ncbi:DeoR/GlpR family DNA-binding transcription regulator [Paenibacillus sp.]|uniref:DeoR/GlpR family DNA-binding transcription regulator n=1 Tax=Paenibacillus sp. TaxID=58172 RepID=UPI002810AB04|nr:DeoR/GlpR family DNA-binding transcription regulator [Paenibacillus sp.]
MEHSKGESRRLKLLERIKQNGKVSIQEIVDEMGCSEATARRDLDLLEKAGKIIRTIGGAVSEGASSALSGELPFANKRSFLRQEKERIADTAAGLVEEGDVICLTGGTTTFFIAKALKELKERRNLTVVTNAVNIAAELADAEDIQVVVIGGVMRSKSYELTGPLAESVIEKLNVAKMFLGVDGVSLTHGFTMHSELEARIAQRLIERSAQVYAVLDHSKLQRTALFTITALDRVTGIVTDRKPEKWFEDACEKHRIRIHY